MSLLGKILTMLNLVMSVAFLALAVIVLGTHTNWRDEVNKAGGFKDQLERARTAHQQLTQEKTLVEAQLNHERAARQAVLGNMQTKIAGLQEQLTARTQERDSLSAKFDTAQQTISTELAKLNRITDEVALLRQHIRDAQQARDEKFKEIVSRTDELVAAQGDLKRLQEIERQLLEQVGTYKNFLDTNGLRLSGGVPGPVDVEGFVEAIDKERVQISIGFDDGLREGHELAVARGADFIGKIRVVKTQPDKAVGLIMKDFRKGIIKVGDRVDTRL